MSPIQTADITFLNEWYQQFNLLAIYRYQDWHWLKVDSQLLLSFIMPYTVHIHFSQVMNWNVIGC